MVRRIVSAFILACLLTTVPAHADIIFEGYYRILMNDIHIGYSIQRYEFDKKKSEFVATSYNKYKVGAIEINDSLKARSTAKLVPLSYEYTMAQVGEKPEDKEFKKITAAFLKNQMRAKVLKNKNEVAVTKDLPKGTYLSVFLPYIILNSKEGLKPDVKYSYSAIAEEDADVSKGEAYVKDKETVDGISVYKVLNRFKKEQFVNLVTADGDALETRNPVTQVQLKLVATKEEAVDKFQFSNSNIALLFGTIPVGKQNALYKKQVAPQSKTLEQVLSDEPEAVPANAAQSAGKTAGPSAGKSAADSALAKPAPGKTYDKLGVKSAAPVTVKSQVPAPEASAVPSPSSGTNE